jgi:diguanylate cyclase (GGDEF)-like protein/PAS domain S-box-containing protein
VGLVAITRYRQGIRLGAIGVAILVNLSFAILIARDPTGALTNWIDYWGVTVLAAVTAVPAALAGHCTGGRRRWGWWLIGLAGVSWAIGNVLYTADPNAVSPALNDLFYLGAVPLAAAGLVLVASQHTTRAALIRLVLDGLTVVPATVFISWALVLNSIWATDTDPSNGYSVAATMTYLAYPLTDILLVALALLVVARHTGRLRLSIGLIAIGYLSLAIADSGYNYYTSIGTYTSTTVFTTEFGYSLGFSLIALGLLEVWLRTRPASDTDPGPGTSRERGLLCYLPVAGAAVMAIRQELIHAPGDGVLFWSGLIVLGMVLLRQMLALRENESLRRSVERRMAELLGERGKLQRNEQRFRSLIENSSDGILILDSDLCVTWASDSLRNVIGQAPDVATGSSVEALIHPDDRARVMRAFRDGLRDSGRSSVLDCRVLDSQGKVHSVDVHVAQLLQDPAVRGVVLNVRDVTERRELEEQLLHQALHDPLTNLPNRLLLTDRLEHELGRRRGPDQSGPAVLFLDIDGFKTVNDTQGHHAGDLLLQQVGKRLKNAMRPGDSIARMGGDEFAVIVVNAAGTAEVDRVAARLVSAMATPFCVEGHDFLISTSVGISISLNGGETAGDLLQQADLAMYRAKELGGNRSEAFVPELKFSVQRRLDTESALRSALTNAEFFLHYQPILDLTSRRMVGTEALVRWRMLDGTVVQPLDFIPLAERCGLIVDIGRWVLRRACEQTRRWQLELPGAEHLSVSVNLSARQLREPDFAEEVLGALRDSHLAPTSLVLEVTESVIVEDIEGASTTLAKLRGEGIRIALDDFGTGYSSLSYLRTLPVDVIKLDRSFVTGIAASATTLAVARSVVTLADALGLVVVAEGIEISTQLDELVRLGCGLGQGFLFSRPVPEAGIEEIAKAAAQTVTIKDLSLTTAR